MELGVKQQSCESQQNNGEFAGSVSIFMEHYPVNNLREVLKNVILELKFLFNTLLLFDWGIISFSGLFVTLAWKDVCFSAAAHSNFSSGY